MYRHVYICIVLCIRVRVGVHVYVYARVLGICVCYVCVLISLLFCVFGDMLQHFGLVRFELGNGRFSCARYGPDT